MWIVIWEDEEGQRHYKKYKHRVNASLKAIHILSDTHLSTGSRDDHVNFYETLTGDKGKKLIHFGKRGVNYA